jgi:hypothetical protein
MKDKTTLLRISYWVGAIIDAKGAFLLAFPTAVPGLYEAFFARSPETTPEFIGVSRIASTMIFAWTCLLLWADKEPRSRKGVLLLTVCPIGFIILLLRFLAIVQYGLTMEGLLGIVFFFLLIGFFAFSYIVNRKPKND